MKKIMFFLFTTIFLIGTTGCNFKAKNTHTISEYCLTVDEYDGIICLDAPIDNTKYYIFVDKNEFENKVIKFKDLNIYLMMVVDVEKNGINQWIILSNPDYSITLLWEGKLPKLESMFYIICKDNQLGPSTLVKSPVSEEVIIDEEIIDEP